MRISILLQREPFSTILEETLASFLYSWTGHAHEVHWYPGHPNLAAMRRRGEQPWVCNIYLNAIFAPKAEPWVLEPVRREFSRSVSRWRRPVQRAYVALAGSRGGARWLAQAGVGISPGLADASQLLIVAGNHKIRLLDRARGAAYGIRKAGVLPYFMQREIKTRRQVEALGLPVPSLESVAEDDSWFCERYIVGTPLNRLANTIVAGRAIRHAVKSLHRLVEATIQEESLGAYTARLTQRAHQLITNNHLLDEEQKQALRHTVEEIRVRTQASQARREAPLATALTHGDFQPANILVDGRQTWLIDWEYSARRQAGYDALTFGLSSRSPSGLAGRMTREMKDVSGSVVAKLGSWPGLSWQDASDRRMYLNLFLIEDLTLHLDENANTNLVKTTEGLTLVLREIEAWLQGTDHG